MRNIWIILKKELLDSSRDRKTIFFMIVMPFLAIFMMFNISMSMAQSQEKKAREKMLSVGLIMRNQAPSFRDALRKGEKLELKENIQESEIPELIRQEKLDFALVFEPDFDQKVQQLQTGEVKMIFKDSQAARLAQDRIVQPLNQYKETLLSERLKTMKLEKGFVEPLKMKEQDLSTDREKVGEQVGGMIPYLLVIFCFLGAMYPAIDLAAGEKERGTLETLLSSPASRGQIVVGKFLVIALAGIITAIVSFVWVYLVFKQNQGMAQEAFSGFIQLIQWKSVILLLSLLIPLCVFFAAILLSASVYAKSYKEAQSIIGPLNFIVIIPVFIGIFPGIKLSPLTALVPILNVSLASKDIVSGTISYGLLAEVYAVLIALAALGLVFCTQWFKRESVIFRGA